MYSRLIAKLLIPTSIILLPDMVMAQVQMDRGPAVMPTKRPAPMPAPTKRPMPRPTPTTRPVPLPGPTSRPTPHPLPRPTPTAPGFGGSHRPPHRPGVRPPNFRPIHRPAYRYPSGYRYHRWHIGNRLPAVFMALSFIINDYYDLGFGAPPPGCRWVRYGPDLVLVNVRTRRIVDVVYGVFY